ncbi:transglycosylase SLT domain-containing protein [Zobellella maritima]|uniref:transglycosylase SLT domain-containing protein n=1 Tax=Zobellella maritima TaxID=2059725 RepID=UPI001E4B496F|nr:transglycosylase SLT domain-containing protein [Zobellella maritima]
MKSWLGIGLLVFSLGVSAQTSSLRERYDAAEQALKRNELTRFQQLRQGLDSYPLTVYLDYELLSRRLNQLSLGEVQAFMRKYPDSLQADRLERAFLVRLAQEQRWQEFLSLYPNLPNSTELQCAHYRAKWALGDRATALAGAERLWLNGRSLPGACTPLFDSWRSVGGRTDHHVWARMELAFELGESGIVSYLSRELGPSTRAAGELLVELDKQPERLANMGAFTGTGPQYQSAVSHGLAKLADTEPNLALRLYPQYQKRLGLSREHVARIERKLAQRLMFNRTREHREWLDSRLPELNDVGLLELRARLAIWEQDWQQLPGWIDRLPPESQQDSRWLYWRGRALSGLRQPVQADAVWHEAAQARDYYGFLAAHQSNRPLALQKQPIRPAPAWDRAAAKWPALRRVDEWMARSHKSNARIEWNHLLSKLDADSQSELGSLALSRHWYDKSILASIQARAWDQLDLRFPVVYRDSFRRQAQRLKIEEATLFAIARQESAFFEQARSPAGAGGLMQLMPGTARETARKHGIPFGSANDVYHPDINVQLGSAYFRELLNRYDNNRILAIAAYNAGPGRINGWLKDSGSRPFDVWVENIPFRETRGYVQNVLAFAVIYQDILGQPKSLLRPVEVIYGY